jgi:hypothetical protein
MNERVIRYCEGYPLQDDAKPIDKNKFKQKEN